ncbi:hypothetical protein TI05_01440 [Achromatium sp. WMS3]|nr:hypothetical protein TI05_01440 [Achromatium sp. WMS3]
MDDALRASAHPIRGNKVRTIKFAMLYVVLGTIKKLLIRRIVLPTESFRIRIFPILMGIINLNSKLI